MIEKAISTMPVKNHSEAEGIAWLLINTPIVAHIVTALTDKPAMDTCRCGHAPEQHDADSDPVMCTVCGDNTSCDYADDEEIAADRWDEGYIGAMSDMCPPDLDQAERLLWAITHMPKNNPYREKAT